MKEKISGLIRLQECDNRIKKMEARKKRGPLKIKQLEEEFDTLSAEFQEKYNKLEALKKEKRKMEQDIQDYENREAKSQVKLGSIKSNKEYTAVLKEIEGMKKERTLAEDNLLRIMEEMEVLEEDYRKDQKEQAELKEKLDADKDEVQNELESLDKQLVALEKKKKELCEEMDQELLKNYNFLKERKGGLAIGSVIQGVCQSCHMEIPPQKFNELIRGHSLMTCPNCNRLCYWGGDEYLMKVLEESKQIMKTG